MPGVVGFEHTYKTRFKACFFLLSHASSFFFAHLCGRMPNHPRSWGEDLATRAISAPVVCTGMRVFVQKFPDCGAEAKFVAAQARAFLRATPAPRPSHKVACSQQLSLIPAPVNFHEWSHFLGGRGSPNSSYSFSSPPPVEGSARDLAPDRGAGGRHGRLPGVPLPRDRRPPLGPRRTPRPH